MPRRLSFPHEHGASLTALGAAVAAVGIAPTPVPALAVGVAVTASFLARGPIDRLAARQPLRAWDRPWLTLLAVLAVLGAAMAGARQPGWALATVVLCAGMVAASATARRAHAQRGMLLEIAGMAGLGASAGLGALAAGAPLGHAIAAALVIGGHSGAAVPLVRTEVRRRERGRGPQAVTLSALAVLVAAGLAVFLAPTTVVLAFAPRAIDIAYRAARRPAPTSATAIGVRETLLLGACVALLIVTL